MNRLVAYNKEKTLILERQRLSDSGEILDRHGDLKDLPREQCLEESRSLFQTSKHMRFVRCPCNLSLGGHRQCGKFCQIPINVISPQSKWEKIALTVLIFF